MPSRTNDSSSSAPFNYVKKDQSDASWGKEIQNENYWDKRYKEDAEKSDGKFEWYVDYDSIAGLLSNMVRKTGRILEVGCGNSNLGMEMAEDQFQDITCIDFSGECIAQQLEKHRETEGLKFLRMDATHMTGFKDEAFDCVVDKATLDAMLSGGKGSAKKMVAEISRILSDRGSYVIVSHVSPSSEMGQEMLNEIVLSNLDWAYSQWTIDIHSIMPDVDEDDDSNGEESENDGPHIYCVKKYLRPRTRSQMAAAASFTHPNKRKRQNEPERRRNVIIRQHFH
mgnify:CR=1 FL=1|jgi:SAM-dependent methyltransferase|eukprot:g6540.t1